MAEKTDLEVFEEAIKITQEQFPGYKMKEFTFTAGEQQILAEQETIIALADRTKQGIFNNIALKRLGIVPNASMVLRYHIALGRFVLFIPEEKKSTSDPKQGK